MNKYEAIFILNPSLSGDGLNSMKDNLTETIAKEGGEVTQVQEWGKRKLSYLIEKHSEGNYILVLFQMATEKIARIRKIYHLNDQLIKFAIFRQEEPNPKYAKRRKEREGEEAAPEGELGEKVSAEDTQESPVITKES